MSKHGTILKTGEAESRSVTVANDVVTMHHVTQHKTAGLVVMDWSFDFTDVSHDKIIELASRSLVIDQRNAWKKLGSSEALDDGQTKQVFKVSDLIVKQKRGKSTAEKLRDITKDMTPEQIQAILELAPVGQ